MFVINPENFGAEVVYVLLVMDIILAVSWAWCMVEENVVWESGVRYDMAVLRRKEVGLKQLSYGTGLEWVLVILKSLEAVNKAVYAALSVMQ